MKTILSFFIVVLLLAGCKKEELPAGTPECIEAKIEAILSGPVWNPPAKVFSYMYEGEKVYYFTSRCCDITSELYDVDCTFLCAPDGGITGLGDGQCPDFISERTDERLIWEDKRN